MTPKVVVAVLSYSQIAYHCCGVYEILATSNEISSATSDGNESYGYWIRTNAQNNEHHQGGRCWLYYVELTGARGWVFEIPWTTNLGGLLHFGALEAAMAAPGVGHSAARFIVF